MDKKKKQPNDDELELSSNVDVDPQAAAKSMFESAVAAENVDEDKPARAPHHFDLAGLAHSLSTEASMAHRITKLRNHVSDA